MCRLRESSDVKTLKPILFLPLKDVPEVHVLDVNCFSGFPQDPLCVFHNVLVP